MVTSPTSTSRWRGGPAPPRRLPHQGGSPGRILCGANSQGAASPPAISLGRGAVRVHLPAVRPGSSTQSLHQAAEAGGGDASPHGNSCSDLHRRYSHIIGVGGREPGSYGHRSGSAAPSGIRHQLGEMSPTPDQMPRVPRSVGQLSDHGIFSSRGEGALHSRAVSGATKRADVVSARASVTNRQDECNGGSRPASAPVLSATTVPEEPFVAIGSWSPGLQPNRHPGCGGETGLAMVGRPPGNVERAAGNSHSARPNPPNGRLERGLGRAVRRDANRGPLAPQGEADAYKRQRAPGGLLGSEVCCQEPQPSDDLPAAGQPDGGGVHQSTRWNRTLARPAEDCASAVGVVHGAPSDSSGRVFARGNERGSRFRVAPFQRLERLAAASESVLCSPGGVSTQSDRPIRQPHKSPATAIFQLETRSGSSGDRCLCPGLARPAGVCVSPVLSDWPLPCETRETTGTISGPRYTSVASSALALPPAPAGHRAAADSPKLTGSPDRPASPTASAGGRSAAPSGRVAAVRRGFFDQGVSPEVVDVLLASWRGNTERAYSSAFRRWSDWCSQRSVPALAPSLAQLLQFLHDQFARGLQYRTITGYRSALSQTLPPVDGVLVGQHPLVSRFLRGVYNRRPPRPRYQTTWRVQQVLDLLRAWGPNGSLSLQQLTKKTAMLLALAGSRRCSEVHQLDLKTMKETESTVSFSLVGLAKNQRPGQPAKVYTFPRVVETPLLCVASTVQEYVRRTSDWRPQDEQESPLLRSVRRPHGPVSAATVGRWLTDVMGAAGIDTSMYRAHSVRGAASSAAARAGMSTADILQCADWAAVSTFRRFYLRDVPDNNASERVGRALLSL